MTRLRVLFVDDEQRVLDGLQRMLRDMRNDWEMDFIADPRAAVAAAAATGYDVVVSDMRMPHLDGAELMARVRECCPASVRIILSGQSDTEAAIRAATVTHTFLAKPCDSATLRAAIDRVHRLRRFVRRDPLVALVNRIDSLPKAPALYQRLIDDLRDPAVTTARVATTLGADPALCLEILKLANSAFFRLSTPIDGIDRAVQMIGMANVEGLVVASAIKQSVRNPDVPAAVFEEVWRESVAAARAARIVAQVSGLGADVRDPAVTASLLHATGRLVLAAYCWGEYRPILERVAAGESRGALEHGAFGVTGAEVGGYLLGLWNLPDALADAVAHHAEPTHLEARPSLVGAVTHVAVLLATRPGDDAEGHADHDYLHRSSLPGDWPAWREAYDTAARERIS